MLRVRQHAETEVRGRHRSNRESASAVFFQRLREKTRAHLQTLEQEKENNAQETEGWCDAGEGKKEAKKHSNKSKKKRIRGPENDEAKTVDRKARGCKERAFELTRIADGERPECNRIA